MFNLEGREVDILKVDDPQEDSCLTDKELEKILTILDNLIHSSGVV